MKKGHAMRTTIFFAGAFLIVSAVARAQQPELLLPTMPNGSNGSIDIGFRTTDLSGDAARAQRFGDLTDGALADRLRFEQRGHTWLFDGGADHLGRTDQRLFATFRASGKVKASFQWDEIPLNISGDTRTLFQSDAPGVLRLDTRMRAGIESGASRLVDFGGTANPFTIGSRRKTAAFDFLYTPTPQVNVTLNLKQARRDGTMPLGASFGFSDAVEVPAPIDTRTTELASGIEWNGRRGMVRVGYNGSWFDNNVQTLLWDNPLKLTDATSSTFYSTGLGGSRGRAALPPSSTMQGITTAGALKLPVKTRVASTITVGTWRQNEALLPATVNSAVPAIKLPRDTAEAEARTLAMNYSLTSQPAPYLWVNARYRYYDFDNRTPIFQPPQFVVMDQTVDPGVPNEPLSLKRQNVDVDVSLMPVPFTAFRVGYSRGIDDHTYRIVERTIEQTYRSSIDLNAGPAILVRGIVERSSRVGSAFDEALLVEIGEQPAMRHYDIADRDRDRATGLLQISAGKYLGFSASAATGKDDYKNSGFGLRSNDNHTYTFAANASAGTKLDGSLSYSLERYSALQNSRTASPGTPQVTDPTRDWSIDSADRAETWSGNLALVKVLPRTEVHLGYDWTNSHATYVYGLPSNTTLAPLVQLPAITNERKTGMADVRVSLTRTLALGVLYWHEAYTVDDFAFSTASVGSLTSPTSLFLGYVFRPYTLDSASLRLILAW
jgi:MtrB/PioB family decaheme-associated outer membrane protein